MQIPRPRPRGSGHTTSQRARGNHRARTDPDASTVQGHTAPTCVSTHRTAPRPNQPGGQCGCSYSPMKHASHSVAEHTLQEQLWFESVPPDAHITFARCCVSWLCHCITRASNPWHTFLILKINAPAKVPGMEVVRLYQRMKPSYLKYSLSWASPTPRSRQKMGFW